MFLSSKRDEGKWSDACLGGPTLGNSPVLHLTEGRSVPESGRFGEWEEFCTWDVDTYPTQLPSNNT